MRLGCLAYVRHVKNSLQHFNEAEAHAPRMPGRTGSGCCRAAGDFNEAEAHAPRMRPFSINNTGGVLELQ